MHMHGRVLKEVGSLSWLGVFFDYRSRLILEFLISDGLGGEYIAPR